MILDCLIALESIESGPVCESFIGEDTSLSLEESIGYQKSNQLNLVLHYLKLGFLGRNLPSFIHDILASFQSRYLIFKFVQGRIIYLIIIERNTHICWIKRHSSRATTGFAGKTQWLFVKRKRRRVSKHQSKWACRNLKILLIFWIKRTGTETYKNFEVMQKRK